MHLEPMEFRTHNCFMDMEDNNSMDVVQSAALGTLPKAVPCCLPCGEQVILTFHTGYLTHPTTKNQKNREITKMEKCSKLVKNHGFDKNGGHHELRLEKS